MKRFPIIGFLLLVPALALFAVIGCQPTDKNKKDADGKAGGGDAGAKDDKKDKAVAIETALDATVKGVVKLNGTVPEMKIDPRIAKHGSDSTFCLSGPEKSKNEQIWMVGKDKELANVVVSLAPPAGKKFKIDDNLKKLSKKTIEIDQPYCNYDPHVVALWPEVQGLVFLNDATVTHNVKIAGTSKMSSPDITLKPKEKSPEQFLKGGGETVIDASCGSHTWMNCKIALFTNPYCAVTKSDGTFEIPNVPVDEELTVYLWHESNPKKVEVQKLKTVKGANELKLEYVSK
jgi:hypothetical protein